MIGRRLVNGLGIAAAVVVLVALCGSAIAYFSTSGNGTASAAVTTLASPKLTATANAGGTVSLSWTASSGPSGTISYYVERDAGSPGGNCPTKASPASVTSCTDSGVAIGSHEYRVVAVYRTWTSSSAVVSANVTVGAATRFSLSGTPTGPLAGEAVNLTITAQDEKGSTVTTFAGSHSLVFSGATASPGNNNPTVANSSGSAVAFGGATAITFTSGVANVASAKNGVMKIYKAGEASVNVSEGSITDPTPLAVNVFSAAGSKFTLAAASATPTAGVEDNLTVTALDPYGNVATGYGGSHNLVYSITSTANSPNGTPPTVANSSGAEVALGTATPVVFTNGVATSSGGANGAVTLYRAGSVTGLKATEGSITNATSPSITVAPAAAASLAMTSSNAAPTAGAGVTLTFTALDAYGNTATSYAGERKLTFSGATASPSGTAPTVGGTAFGSPTTIVFSAGTKTATMVLTRAASSTISATDGTLTTAGVGETVAPAAAAKVAWVNLTQSAGSGASSCFLTCSISGVGNGGTVTGNIEIVDTYGNLVSNYGASKTGTVTASTGTVTGGSLAFPETGPAVSTTQFTYAYPASGTTTATLTGASTSRTSVTGTVAK